MALRVRPRRCVWLVVASALSIALLAGCASRSAPSSGSAAPGYQELEHYVAQIEPIRRGVNHLLDRGDPILKAFAAHRISNRVAAARMAVLERRFAEFAVEVAMIRPSSPGLRSLHAGYAHTYILEDAYLSALVSGLRDRDLDHLPDTQSAQRATIIDWRTDLTVLARQARAPLPADLQEAGRGEIAPSLGGS